MERSLEEQKLLDKLGIKDFRHMTKDKIVAFASELPNMDPQVAIEAIRQFPEFAKTSLQLVDVMQKGMSEVLDKADTSQKTVYKEYSALLDSLRAKLMQPNLSMEEHDHIFEQMKQVIELMHNMDKENKDFLQKVLGTVVGGVAVIATASAAVLGVRTISRK